MRFRTGVFLTGCVVHRCSATSSISGLGTATAQANLPGAAKSEEIPITVGTPKLSGFTDRRQQLQVSKKMLVSELKEMLAKKFPGRPPASLQRLFCGTQLLQDDITLEEASTGIEGRLQLLLDMPPAINIEDYDPSTVVPSTRDGQLDAYCANLAVYKQFQLGLSNALRGIDSSDAIFNAQRCAADEFQSTLDMRQDMEATKEYIKSLFKEPARSDNGDEDFPTPPPGLFHEQLRPLVKQFDVEWKNTLNLAFFLYLCAKFGVEGPLVSVARTCLVPLLFLFQLRAVKFIQKIGWNLIPVVPGLAETIVALLPAPEQMLLTFDEQAYVRNLYGPGGPQYHPEYVRIMDEYKESRRSVDSSNGDLDLDESSDFMTSEEGDD